MSFIYKYFYRLTNLFEVYEMPLLLLTIDNNYSCVNIIIVSYHLHE